MDGSWRTSRFGRGGSGRSVGSRALGSAPGGKGARLGRVEDVDGQAQRPAQVGPGGVLGAGLTAVTSSGVAIWLARRRDKGRPAPRWERIWIATVWSQPLAYAASLLVAVPVVVPARPRLATADREQKHPVPSSAARPLPAGISMRSSQI